MTINAIGWNPTASDPETRCAGWCEFLM